MGPTQDALVDVIGVTMDGGVVLGDAAPSASEAGVADARADGAPEGVVDQGADAEAIRPIADCAAACARYAECGRDDVLDPEACLADCERAAGSDLAEQWFRCLEVESCELLHSCLVPEPPALTCAEVCAAVTDCGVPSPLGDCETVCDLDNEGGGYSVCGESLHGQRCDVAAFWACMGIEVYEDCGRRCALSVECELEEGDACMPACLEEGLVDDPLSLFHAQERNRCVSFSGLDCERAADCLNPTPWEAVLATLENLCVRWDACYAPEIPCEMVRHAFLVVPSATECVIGRLQRECPMDEQMLLMECFERAARPGPSCFQLCEAREACGDLPAEEDARACHGLCAMLLEGGTPEERFALQERMACSQAQTCPEFLACLAPEMP